MTKTKNAGIFGLLLFMLLTGCDFVEPDDQFQLRPDFRSDWESPKARYGKSRFHPRKFIRAICIGPGFTYRLNILGRPQSL